MDHMHAIRALAVSSRCKRAPIARTYPLSRDDYAWQWMKLPFRHIY
jgi:hypothetical protein